MKITTVGIDLAQNVFGAWRGRASALQTIVRLIVRVLAGRCR
jgi:hypothetical protein